MMNMSILPKADLKPLDDLLVRPDGLLRVVPSGKLLQFPIATLQLWCVQRGVYQFPTEELLAWLSQQIAGRKAIEICAGNGVLGRELGIISTDSYMQTDSRIIAYYKAMGQKPITPPADVQKYDANAAVKHFQPEVVIGAWVTQLHQEGDASGSVVGVDEMAILQVAKYIHIGNDKAHAYKMSMHVPHEHHRFPWLVSRGIEQRLNHACVCGKPT